MANKKFVKTIFSNWWSQNSKWDENNYWKMSSKYWYPTKNNYEDDVSLEMASIVRSLRSILMVHGVPSNVVIELESYTNCAGTAHWRSNTPIITLGKSIYDMVSEDKRLDCYCGIALHEGSHLLHSPKAYAINDEYFGMIYNLIEDERIERKITEDSPGFTFYLDILKKEILEPKTIESLNKLDLLTDINKFFTFLYACTRLPHLINKYEDYKIRNVNIVQKFESLLDKQLVSHDDTVLISKSIYDFMKQLFNEQLSPRSQSIIEIDIQELFVINRGAFEQEEISNYNRYENFNTKHVGKYTWESGEFTHIFYSDKLPLNNSLYQSLYKRLYGNISNYISKMASVLQFRSVRNKQIYEKQFGKLHNRKLAKANIDQNIFRQIDPKIINSCSISILLDQSGSIQYYREEIASIAILLASACKNLPLLDINIYSHTEGTYRSGECEIYKLYSSGENISKIVGYTDLIFSGNTDSVAIKFVGEKLLKESKSKDKILIIISDGLPCGYGDPRFEVAKEVKKLKGKGVEVCGIGVGGQCSKEDWILMYSNPIFFTNFNKLCEDMMKFFIKLLAKQSYV